MNCLFGSIGQRELFMLGFGLFIFQTQALTVRVAVQSANFIINTRNTQKFEELLYSS